MKTAQDQAFDRLLKKLSAMRATLRNEERAILDEIIIGEVSTHRMKVGRKHPQLNEKAKTEASEVEAHRLTTSKVTPRVTEKVTPRVTDKTTPKVTEVEAHKLTTNKVTPRTTEKVTPRVTDRTTPKVTEVEAHRLTTNKVTPRVTDRATPIVTGKATPKVTFDSKLKEYIRIDE